MMLAFAIDQQGKRNTLFTMRLSANLAIVLDWSLNIAAAQLGELVNYWMARRRTRDMPSRADLDPADLRLLLRHVFLVDVLRDPLAFRYRLVGTNIVRVAGRDVTGLHVADAVPKRLRHAYVELYTAVAENRAPLRVTGSSWFVHNDFLEWEAVLLPLAPERQPVNMLLGGLVFRPREARNATPAMPTGLDQLTADR